ncbi:MAG: hypothetical protein AB8H80_23165 [Planctomycetota bacterium]
MTGMLSTLPRRLFAACAFAAVAIALLALLVERFEAPPKKTMRGEGAASLLVEQPNAASTHAGDLGSGAIEAAGAVIEPFAVAADSVGAAARVRAIRGGTAGGLGASDAVFRLQPPAGKIAVARRLASLSPEIAPVVEILPSGRFALRRSAPLPSGPLAYGTASRASAPPGQPSRARLSAPGREPGHLAGLGYGAGIVLPGAGLESLTPEARGALLQLLSRWLLRRPAEAGQLEAIDLTWTPASLRRLLSWLP